MMLGLLRLGERTSARAVLDASFATMQRPPCGEDAWTVVAHAWFANATGDQTIAVRGATLMELAAALPPAPPFAGEALAVHAGLCASALGRGEGAHARAVTRLCTLEQVAWRSDPGLFAGRLPELENLVPAAAGLLLASGDRVLRHLRTSLAAATTDEAAWPGHRGTLERACLLLATAAELGESTAIGARLDAVLSLANGESTPGDAGFALDTIWFAITGQRLATGAGLEERPLRLRPVLPNGHDRLTIRGLVAGAGILEVELVARDGSLATDERNEPAAEALGGRRLRVHVTRADPGPGPAQRLAVQGCGVQYLCELRPGETLARSLPR